MRSRLPGSPVQVEGLVEVLHGALLIVELLRKTCAIVKKYLLRRSGSLELGDAPRVSFMRSHC